MATQTYKIGDCLELIKEIPDKSVKLIIFDPPYSRFSGSDGIETNIGDYKILECFFKELSFDFKRILMDAGSIFGFCDFRTYPCLFYGMYYNFKPKNLIVWKKNFIGPGIGFRPLHELIVYWGNERTQSPKDRNISDIWDAPRVRNKNHSYEKPIELYKIMIENCTDEEDMVFDTFLGTGTTLRACRELNRNGFGFEINPRYSEIIDTKMLKGVQSLETWNTDEKDAYNQLKLVEVAPTK